MESFCTTSANTVPFNQAEKELSSDRPQRRPRRSHVKSKSGCLVCRKRHVKCDEARPSCRACLRLGIDCEFPDGAKAIDTTVTPRCIDPSLWNDRIERDIDGLVKTGRVPPSLKAVPLLANAITSDLTAEDVRIIYHLASIASELALSGGDTLCFGHRPIPQFFEQACVHECAKDGLMVLSTYHLFHVTKLPALESLHLAYKQKAFKSLGIALKDFSSDTADAVLAASIMLSFGTDDSYEFAEILHGTTMILAKVDPKQSRLTNVFTPPMPLPTNDKRLVVAYLGMSEPELMQMKPIISGLTTFIQRYKQYTDLCTAARALLKFVHNLPLFPPNLDVLGQAKVICEVKTWLPWIPTLGLMLGLRVVPAIILMSYFYAVLIASEAYLPDVGPGLFLQQRAETIGRNYKELMRLRVERPEVTEDVDEALDLVIVPLVYAVRHRTQHAVRTKSRYVY